MSEEHYNSVSQTTFKQMAAMDGMSKELRECIHEYGFSIVDLLVRYGITEPKAIHTIVAGIWRGARSPANTTRLPQALTQLDWALMQSGSQLSLKTLIRIVHENSWAIVPTNPTRAMLDASMKTVADFDMKLTKERKHLLRYNAAIKAAKEELERRILEMA